MKRFLYILVSLLVVSCGPSVFTLDVEKRGPSSSGFSFGGKNISVLYPDNGIKADSLFLAYVSEGFARALEKDYFAGEESIGIYRIENKAGDNLAAKDSLVNLLVETDADVLFLFDMDSSKDLGLYVYDAMSPEDSVYRYTGGNVSDRLADAVAKTKELGSSYAGIFLSGWKQESFDIILFETDGLKWYEAADAAYGYRWKDAMDIWMGLLDTKDMQKRGCAEYNIALACHMLGQTELALEWLDRADKDFPISSSVSLRKKILEE